MQSLVLQPAVEPVEIGSLPKDTVLWFQHPVVFVGEDEQLGFDATQTGGVEGSHALVGVDAVVLLAVDAEDGGVPLVDEAMRRVVICPLGILRLVLVPIGIIVFPVGEPHLFRVSIH